MAARIYYGDANTESAMNYVPMSRQLSEFVEDFNSRSVSLLNDVGRRFHDRARDFRRSSGYLAVEGVRSRLRRAMEVLDTSDVLKELQSLDDFVTARPRMRRWIMAEPTILTRYRDKQLQGWDRSVEDIAPADPYENPDYQYVMNGWLTEEGFVQYINPEVEDLEDNERLTEMEMVNIHRTWERARSFIENEKYDPTSLWGALIE